MIQAHQHTLWFFPKELTRSWKEWKQKKIIERKEERIATDNTILQHLILGLILESIRNTTRDMHGYTDIPTPVLIFNTDSRIHYKYWFSYTNIRICCISSEYQHICGHF